MSSDDSTGSTSSDSSSASDTASSLSSSSSSASSRSSSEKKSKEKRKHHHHRHHHHHKRSRSSSPKKHRSRSRSKSHKKHKKEHKHKHHHHHKKHHKKEKKERKSATACDGAQWGKYGVLQDADRARMRPEFFAWLAEVKHIDAETLTDRRLEAELWRAFVEDFNTATLPSTKYYNLAAWEHEQQQGQRRQPGGDEGSFIDDEAALRAEQKRAREAQRRAQLAQQVREMRADTAKQSDMAHQEELRLLQHHLWRAGDEQAAHKIAERLRPDVK